MVEFCRTLPEVVANTDNSIELVQRLEQEQKYIEEFFGIRNLKQKLLGRGCTDSKT